jgi:hypothetical protein
MHDVSPRDRPPDNVGSVSERQHIRQRTQKEGMDAMGKKSPHRKIMGKRKKFENVWASKTSFTETAIKSP